MCIHRTLINALQGLFCAENKDTKEIGPLGGNWRERTGCCWTPEPGNSRPQQPKPSAGESSWEKFRTANRWKMQKMQFFARRNTFYFRLPTTYFPCTILSRRRGSFDATAEAQPVISPSPNNWHSPEEHHNPPLGSGLSYNKIFHFNRMYFPRSIKKHGPTLRFPEGNLFM